MNWENADRIWWSTRFIYKKTMISFKCVPLSIKILTNSVQKFLKIRQENSNLVTIDNEVKVWHQIRITLTTIKGHAKLKCLCDAAGWKPPGSPAVEKPDHQFQKFFQHTRSYTRKHVELLMARQQMRLITSASGKMEVITNGYTCI